MKKLNVKSDVYYIDKAVIFKALKLAKVHLIDDDCNEFIATVKTDFILRGYNNPACVMVLDYEEYTSEKWEEMTRYIEYERAILI